MSTPARTLLGLIMVCVMLCAAVIGGAVAIGGSGGGVIDEAGADSGTSIRPPDDAFMYRDSRETGYRWAEVNGLVAHGMGGIGASTVTNSLEAFVHNYAAGYRVFEVDFEVTRDGHVVARHNWDPAASRDGDAKIPSRDEYLASRIHGKYTPLDIAEIIELMRRYPDIYVMTDIKPRDLDRHMGALDGISEALADEPKLRDRFIVQIYDGSELDYVRSKGFREIVFTFYLLRTTREAALDFCEREHIRFVTIPKKMATASVVQDIRARGLWCATHTVNDEREARDLRSIGVTHLYSDYLRP